MTTKAEELCMQMFPEVMSYGSNVFSDYVDKEMK